MRYRAVILDDNQPIRQLLWKLFDERGYEVFTFPDPGLCPLHVVSECPCPAFTSCADIIISDLNMVDGNGLDFIEQLLHKGCKHRRFALMSGDFSAADRARAERLGCAVFNKPLDLAAIKAWIDHVEHSTPPDRPLLDWHSIGIK